MRIAVTIDVEEEGLFSGRYSPVAEGVTNVARLDRLAWLARDLGLPLTLLADYPVIADSGCAALLTRWREDLGAEIGAHLHPWNTPPFDDAVDNLDSGSMPPELVAAKLARLRDMITDRTGTAPVSFRMGRWDFSDTVRRAVEDAGFLVDSSVVPLKTTPAGNDWFNAPADPHFLGSGDLFEVPPTMVPVFPAAARLAARSGPTAMRKFSTFMAVGVQPVWYSLAAMKLAAILHERRGGEVLTLFFHSSELLPGASPHFPTEDSVTAFLDKLRAFFDWLGQRTELSGCTLSDLRSQLGGRS